MYRPPNNQSESSETKQPIRRIGRVTGKPNLLCTGTESGHITVNVHMTRAPDPDGIGLAFLLRNGQ